ncbi:PHP domain-containing protein [Arsenicicoccus sp. oral taxon 190]|uniref:PHP domain-containing protein n=1 Tax=Arsenicicoccus sp. oral taxon 190 TaxID=1658671 RepID=UPI00067B87BF|nr:PHP domain-containing protein [Arsenicicoccus sp. oral taxon 190]
MRRDDHPRPADHPMEPVGPVEPVEPVGPVPAASTGRPGASRRQLLAGAGAALGLGLVPGTFAATPADARPRPRPQRWQWLVGDHHVHTVFSHDAKYLVGTQVAKAREFGVDWMVFTEHANVAHHTKGAAMEKALLEQLRRDHPELLIYQGLEWYIPAAEHCSVIVAPGPRDVDLIREFEQRWDGKLNRWEKPAPGTPQVAEWEAKAVQALQWLAEQRRARVVDDLLVLANHPLRLGIDSPHELRAWRDAAPDLMIGMEGAPGAQAGAWGPNPQPSHQRGEYENAPSPYSWPGFPLEAYRTRGGFDWATAVVGGLWDSLLAEGRPYWITSNSDHHNESRDRTTTGPYPAGESFDTMGRRPDPVPTADPQGGGDYWPGEFSRNHTGVEQRTYRGVLQALREGRSWVDHGHLVHHVEVEVTGGGPAGRGRGHGYGRQVSATLGGRVRVRRGSTVTVSVTIHPTTYRNAWGILPRLAHVDVIAGRVTGPAADRDTWQAPGTRVVRTFDTTGRGGPFTLRHELVAEEPGYVRLRGSDGNRHGVGPMGAAVDPHGPVPHDGTPGAGNPWTDTWFYTNPVFIDVV